MKAPRVGRKRSVEVEPFLGEGAFGPQFGPPQTVPHCRVEYEQRLVKTGDGEDIVSKAVVIMDPDVPFALRSRVTVDGEKLAVVKVDRPGFLSDKPITQELVLG